jgi:RimJ/RimL family protein N-acetyltransferase
MLGHAFQAVGRVVFRVGAGNWRSRRAVEKIGAVLHARGPDALGRDGVVYVLTKTAFAQGPLVRGA